MNLHKTIEHARKVSLEGYADYHKENAQLADWLEELERFRGVLGDDYNLDRLQQLIAADKAGKIAILKYAPGQIVYRTMISPDKKSAQIIIEKCKDEYDSLMLARTADVFESLEGAASSLINLMS